MSLTIKSSGGDFDLRLTGVTSGEVLDWLERTCSVFRISEDIGFMQFIDSEFGPVRVTVIEERLTDIYFSSPGACLNSIAWARLAAIELGCRVQAHNGLAGFETADLWFVREGEREYYVDEEGHRAELTLEQASGACSPVCFPAGSLFPANLSSVALREMFAVAEFSQVPSSLKLDSMPWFSDQTVTELFTVGLATEPSTWEPDDG